MRIAKWILPLIVVLTVVACGSATPAVDTNGEIDLATLPETIDVHTAAALQDREDVILIDVREQWEYDAGHIPNITLIPMSEIEQRVSEIPTDKTVLLSCQSGVRSTQVYQYLDGLGYSNIHNVSGGIAAWEKAGYEVEQ